MTVAVFANDKQWRELKNSDHILSCHRLNSVQEITGDTDAFIVLDETLMPDFTITSKPILFNQVIFTTKEMNTTPNVVRINGWNTFIERRLWEVAGIITEPFKQLFSFLKKDVIIVPDEPGFISARIVAMIINEAYFALGEGVSTKDEINVAMKLGTNYPFGPFEWASLIGVKNVYVLLEKLSRCDLRYLPAPLLQQEAAWV